MIAGMEEDKFSAVNSPNKFYGFSYRGRLAGFNRHVSEQS